MRGRAGSIDETGVAIILQRGLLGLEARAVIGLGVSGDVEQVAKVIAEIDEVERTVVSTGPTTCADPAPIRSAATVLRV